MNVKLVNTIKTHILPSILQSKDSQKNKCGQLIEDNNRNVFFFKDYAENEVGILVLLLLFKKALYEIKASTLWLSFNIFR